MPSLSATAASWAVLASLIAVEPAEAANEPQALVAPVQRNEVQPVYPAEAGVDGPEGDVVLALTLDATGRVTAVEVHRGLDPRLDAAAQDAAWGLEFEPARRGETAIEARILVAFSFVRPEPEAEAEPEAEPAPSASGTVEGTVWLPDGSAPMVGARVELVAEDGTPRSARTDVRGHFAFEDVASGPYRLRAEGLDIGAAEVAVTVEAGETTAPRLVLLAADAPEPIEVTVQGVSEATALARSAQAVKVVSTEDAKRETADLGEVLARTSGVGLRRSGGLGAASRFSLNGLTDDQVRFFLDGVPLEYAGYPFGIANIPVNLIQRVDVFQGVVPIRFGADALGGAVNVVTDDAVQGTHGGVSYQVGSFGTNRATANVRHLDAKSGFFTRAAGFFDYARNDYRVDVEVTDAQGQLRPAEVTRFHDGYRATGASVELGVVEKRWAERLVVRAFFTDYDKELQNNVVMTVPYGDVTYGGMSTGASVRHLVELVPNVELETVVGYAFQRRRFEDTGECVYDWFGQCQRERAMPGEIEGRAYDQRVDDDAVYGRVNAAWQIRPHHALRLSASPTFVTREGKDAAMDENTPDPLQAQRDLMKFVTGLEYQLDVVDERLQNIAFAKSYVQILRADDPLPGGGSRERDTDTYRFGGGDALRFRFTDWLWAKASYEYATRLPSPEEVFGNAALIVANLELRPETSHNGNLGLTVDAADTRAGGWRLNLSGFVREAERLIVLLGNDRLYTYQNVFGATSMGLEASAGWTSPGDYVALDGNVTYQDFRNTSRQGAFADYEGDRIPNRPYLFANGTARLGLSDVVVDRDRISLLWTTRYVHGFYRGWESVGLREYKQTVDAQLLHSLGLTYLVQGDALALSFTAEAQNLTDARAFDFFGVQKPGRAFYFKTGLDF